MAHLSHGGGDSMWGLECFGIYLLGRYLVRMKRGKKVESDGEEGVGLRKGDKGKGDGKGSRTWKGERIGNRGERGAHGW